MASKVDEIVEGVVLQFLGSIAGIPRSQVVDQNYMQQVREIEVCLAQAKVVPADYQSMLKDYNDEIIKVIRGTSHFSSELLESKISETKQNISLASENVASLTEQLNNTKSIMAQIDSKFDNLLEWSELYKTSSLEAKKIIMGHLIRSVKVCQDYDIHIEFNISYSQFIQQQNLTATA